MIYYGFEVLDQNQLARDLNIAEAIRDVTGYQIIKTENSTGGYSDWVSLNLGVPAYTIEVGESALSHPIGLDQLPKIFEQNKDVPLTVLNKLNQLNAPKPNEQKYTLAQKLVRRLTGRK